LPVVEAGDAGHPRSEEQRAGLLAVGVVRGVDDLFRWHEPQQLQQVDRAPYGRVEEDAALTGEAVREVREIGDAGVREDELHSRMRVDHPLEPLRNRWQAAAGVDEDRHAALGREREDGDEPLVLGHELLCTRMELDPTSAEVETALRLLDRSFVQV